MSRIAIAILLAASVVGLSGCWGAKWIKGPINTEHAAMQADSIRADQRRILLELARMQRQFEEERDARLRSQAQTSTTLSELDESVRILTSRIEESTQRTNVPGGYSRPTTRRVTPPPSAADTASTDTTRGGGGLSDGPGAAEDMYRAAYLDLTRGNYTLAITGFQNYLVNYPSGVHIPEVHYYLGECYYSEERYLEAVGAFQDVIRKYPASRLVPAAYLKSGYCYRQLEERNLAEKAFRTLIEKHPDTEEAKQARAALAELEG